jgi:hypothetical protein
MRALNPNPLHHEAVMALAKAFPEEWDEFMDGLGLGDDEREYFTANGKVIHIRRPDASDDWDPIRVTVWIGRKNQGEWPAYCGVDTAPMAPSNPDTMSGICGRCLVGYYADPDA